ncbi:hypothetical protein H0H93_003619, partial [Arthromyces matolae]
VRQNWAHELDRSSVWGRGPRVRIALRRALGRAPTEEEFETAFWSERSYDEITKDDIAQALLRGEEVRIINFISKLTFSPFFWLYSRWLFGR